MSQTRLPYYRRSKGRTEVGTWSGRTKQEHLADGAHAPCFDDQYLQPLVDSVGKGILTRLATVLVVDGSVVFLGGGSGDGDLDDGLHFGFGGVEMWL